MEGESPRRLGRLLARRAFCQIVHSRIIGYTFCSLLAPLSPQQGARPTRRRCTHGRDCGRFSCQSLEKRFRDLLRFLWPERKFVYLQSIMMNCWQQLPSRWNIYQNLSSLFVSSRTAGFICNTVRGQPASANLGGNQKEGVVERNPISPLTTPSIKI